MCPFIVCIGPQKKISSLEVKNGFSGFYHAFFKTKDFDSAMKSMTEETSLNFIQTSDVLAKEIIEKMKNYQVSDVELSEQVEKLIKKGKQLLPNKNFNRNVKALKKYKKEFLRNELRTRYNNFLMIDTYPENAKKFPSFDMIWESVK